MCRVTRQIVCWRGSTARTIQDFLFLEEERKPSFGNIRWYGYAFSNATVFPGIRTFDDGPKAVLYAATHSLGLHCSANMLYLSYSLDGVFYHTSIMSSLLATLGNFSFHLSIQCCLSRCF